MNANEITMPMNLYQPPSLFLSDFTITLLNLFFGILLVVVALNSYNSAPYYLKVDFEESDYYELSQDSNVTLTRWHDDASLTSEWLQFLVEIVSVR
jgi:hypothetical protein